MGTATESVELIDDELVGNLVRAALFAALMGAFAYVSFPNPLSPSIPVTLQVFGVFLAGIMLGAVWGSAAMLLYLVAGVMGAPVFAAGSAGLGVIFSQTGGFLLAFPIAAAVIGVLTHGGLTVTDYREIHVARLVGAMVGGVVVIYAMGVVGMMIVLALGPVEALLLGAVPFVPAEAAKIAAAIGIVRSDRIAAI